MDAVTVNNIHWKLPRTKRYKVWYNNLRKNTFVHLIQLVAIKLFSFLHVCYNLLYSLYGAKLDSKYIPWYLQHIYRKLNPKEALFSILNSDIIVSVLIIVFWNNVDFIQIASTLIYSNLTRSSLPVCFFFVFSSKEAINFWGWDILSKAPFYIFLRVKFHFTL